MRLVIEVPDDLHRAAKARAAMEGVSLKGLVRRLLEDYVDVREVSKGYPLPGLKEKVMGALAKMPPQDAVSKTTVPKSTAKRPLPDMKDPSRGLMFPKPSKR